jgi:N-acetylmuramoyl-L-alanine amidase
VLAIALDTATVLRKLNLHVVLTRTEDRTLSADERLAIAQTANASALVSLHLNATSPPQPNVNGLETYQYPNTAASAKLAQAVHSNLVQTLQLTDRGIKAATFPILRSPTIPAIHLELGFLTGTQDALNLANPDYRTKLSQAIAVGILQFAKKPVG